MNERLLRFARANSIRFVRALTDQMGHDHRARRPDAHVAKLRPGYAVGQHVGSDRVADRLREAAGAEMGAADAGLWLGGSQSRPRRAWGQAP